MDVKKMRREYQAKQQRLRLLRGEISVRPGDARIVRIVDYKAVWKNELTSA